MQDDTATSADKSTDTSMTPEEVKDVDDLIALAESQQASLTIEQMYKLEDWITESAKVRRMTLLTLTKPFAETQESIENDRDLAEALATLYVHQEDLINGLKALLACAEQSHAWLSIALTVRDDYEELIQFAESGD